MGVRADGDETELGLGDDVRRLGDIVLVLDIADDLLDEILNGDETVGAAVLVDDQRHVDTRRLHADQEVGRRHRRRDVKHRPANLRRRDGPREIDAAEVELLRTRRRRTRLAGFASRRRHGDARVHGIIGGFVREPAKQILDVDHAARIIERLAEERDARNAGLAERAQAARPACRSLRER